MMEWLEEILILNSVCNVHNIFYDVLGELARKVVAAYL